MEKIKIVIFGTGSLSKIVTEAIRENVEIIGYTSSYNNLKQKFNCYINLEDLKDVDYDYLIIASQFVDEILKKIEGIVEKNKIIKYFFYHNTNSKYMEFKENIEYYDTVVMGMSYAEKGFNYKYINEKLYNMANSSEDIYYTSELLSLIIKNNKNNIKNLILDLPYYFMNYDMSQTNNMIKRGTNYINILQDSHNYNLFKFDINEYKIVNILFNKDKIEKNIISRKDILLHDREFKINTDILTKEEFEKGKYIEQYEKYYNRVYPKTKVENLAKLNKIVNMCKEQGIRLIITVMPSLLKNNGDIIKKSKKEFYEIISELKEKYEIEIYDFFADNDFNRGDFYDYTHLNYYGSRKLSIKIKEIL